MTECQKETPKTSTDLLTTRVLLNMNCQQVKGFNAKKYFDINVFFSLKYTKTKN